MVRRMVAEMELLLQDDDADVRYNASRCAVASRAHAGDRGRGGGGSSRKRVTPWRCAMAAAHATLRRGLEGNI